MTKDTVIVKAISDLVVQILAADQPTEFAIPVAPLTDGRIKLGRHFLNDRTSPSSIIFIPIRSAFGPPNVKSNQVKQTVNGIANVQPGAQTRKLMRALATDLATYEVHCWGQANPADPEKDFDATRYLAHVVIQAANLLAMASVHPDAGFWEDQQEGAPQHIKAGHRFRFLMSIELPVTDSAVQFPPATLAVVPTVNVTSAGGGV